LCIDRVVVETAHWEPLIKAGGVVKKKLVIRRRHFKEPIKDGTLVIRSIKGIYLKRLEELGKDCK
jgi:hypothetical protein